MKTFDIIIFDGVCNLCNATVQFIIKRDKKNIFRFAPMQSDIAKKSIKKYNIDANCLDTIILIEENGFFVKSDAALQIFRKLNYPWKFFYFFKFIPKFMRDWVYEIIAQNRYQCFGKRITCMVPADNIKHKFLDDKI